MYKFGPAAKFYSHYLNDTIRLKVLSKGPRVGNECDLMLLFMHYLYTGHILKYSMFEFRKSSKHNDETFRR